MLGTRERTLLLDSLRPPAGYRLRRAVGTTFTLDLMALLTAPLAFTFFDAHDQDGVPVADPVALLEALRRHAQKITLFCQAGAIGVPAPEQTLLAYLEGSVIAVQPRQPGAIFHPKTWVLNFHAADRPAIYRVLCLSRNLTFARSWDTCLRLEGRLTQRQRGYGRNKPFADFMLALPKISTRTISAELQADLNRMAYEIRRVDFKLPRPFRDFRVHNFGLKGRPRRPFPDGGRSLVVSPFLVGSFVRDLLHDHGLEILISRPEAFDEVLGGVGREALPQRCYVLSSGADLNAREAEEEDREGTDAPLTFQDDIELAGLHAKLFLFEKGRESRLFTGSANATGAAFGGNVEMLVELIGKKKDCGVEALLGSEDDPNLETLRSLLQEYQPGDLTEVPPDPRKALERSADRLARLLGAASLTATVHEVREGQEWDMTLSGKLPDIPETARVKVWPVTLPAEAARPIGASAEQGREDAPTAVFEGLSFEALTAFFAFELSLREERQEVRRRFAMTAQLIGAPTDRRERLLRSLLKDRRRVLQLLFLILMGEGADVSEFIQAMDRDSPAAEVSFAGWDQSALLEALLRCLSRNPERIDEVARLISDLEKTPQGANLLPEGLSEIWSPVRAARKAVKS